MYVRMTTTERGCFCKQELRSISSSVKECIKTEIWNKYNYIIYFNHLLHFLNNATNKIHINGLQIHLLFNLPYMFRPSRSSSGISFNTKRWPRECYVFILLYQKHMAVWITSLFCLWSWSRRPTQVEYIKV